MRDAFPGAPLQEFEAVAVDEANKVIYIGDEKGQGVFVLTAPPPFSISTISPLSQGTSSQPYSQSLSATGGSTPYSFSLINGSLPTGLSLSPAGAISGVPTTCGSYTFTVQAQDSSMPFQSDSKSFLMNISFSGPAGDVTTDGLVNGNDVQGFTAAYLDPNSGICGADLNGDFSVNDVDVPLFVSALLAP
ncbi:MAG TPA: putative Ig domain-containing protein [Phycisphaerae bacterium]|nr:putative Ig domain-containing protein [Phycisphaerae bacterium]